jgi:tRNA (guanine37-N1)-methyltransferase
MQIDVITIFPSLFEGFINESMIKIAREKSLLDLNVHDLRDWTENKHRQVDDIPYGGGSGMVMKPDMFYKAVLAVGGSEDLNELRNSARIVLFTPRGKQFDQKMATEFSKEDRIIMLCGRYEGIDERVHEHIATDEVSIGDFVLNGGEIAAMAVIEASVRLIPGALGAADSLSEESFTDSLLEYPQYTRPPEFNGWTVPEVLLSGHHAQISKWRRKERLLATFEKRPDLLSKAELSKEDKEFLDQLENQRNKDNMVE